MSYWRPYNKTIYYNPTAYSFQTTRSRTIPSAQVYIDPKLMDQYFNYMLINNYKPLYDKFDELNKKIEQLTEENSELRKQISDLNEEITRQLETIHMLERENTDLKHQVAQLIEDVHSAQDALDSLEQQIGDLEAQNATLSETVTRLDNENSQLHDQVSSLESENHTLNQEIINLNEELSELRRVSLIQGIKFDLMLDPHSSTSSDITNVIISDGQAINFEKYAEYPIERGTTIYSHDIYQNFCPFWYFVRLVQDVNSPTVYYYAFWPIYAYQPTGTETNVHFDDFDILKDLPSYLTFSNNNYIVLHSNEIYIQSAVQEPNYYSCCNCLPQNSTSLATPLYIDLPSTANKKDLTDSPNAYIFGYSYFIIRKDILSPMFVQILEQID